jgi:hypothetical protein
VLVGVVLVTPTFCPHRIANADSRSLDVPVRGRVFVPRGGYRAFADALALQCELGVRAWERSEDARVSQDQIGQDGQVVEHIEELLGLFR